MHVISFKRLHSRTVLMSAAVLALLLAGTRPLLAQGPSRFASPTKSGPLALSADDSLLAVANPDNDTVTIFDVREDHNQKLAEVKVGREPSGVAISPDGSTVYAANTIDGTVSVITINRSGNPVAAVGQTLKVGTEPYGVAMTPNGTKVYVTNARSNSVSVIDTNTKAVLVEIANIGPTVGSEPRGIAITNNGDDKDDDEIAYITHFYSFATNKLDGEDDSKTALVTRILTKTDAVAGQVILKNLPDTGFKAPADAIAKEESKEKEADGKTLKSTFVTGAYPNQLQAIAIKNGFAYLPNTGASPNGPIRFNNNTHALLHVINTSNNQDAGQTINLHRAVAAQPAGTRKLFPTVPWAIAFKNKENVGYVVSAGSNIVVKIAVDPKTGASAVATNPLDNRIADVAVGRNPRGIVINSTDTRAYVANYVSRDVTVLDLTRNPEQVSGTMRSAALATAGTPEELALAGKELYNTSVGEFEKGVGNMSADGWGSCGSCHPFGLADNVVWIFGSGPRRTISQHQDFAGGFQRALNWSAVFDEEHDFELNIRTASGGKGLLTDASGALEATAKIGGLTIGDPAQLAPANSARGQLKFRTQSGQLVNAWDAIIAYEKTIRGPISPANQKDPDVIEGRAIFIQNNCQSCHGGPKWSSSRIDGPITDLKLLKAGQITAQLSNVGTFNPAIKNEVRANGKPPLGADGFVPPSLLGVFAFPPYFHNGTANSIEEVMSDKFITHRAAGTGGVDGLTNAEDRRKLVRFLYSIDASTQPVAP